MESFRHFMVQSVLKCCKSEVKVVKVNPSHWLRGGLHGSDWRVWEAEFQRDCVEQVKSSRSHEGQIRDLDRRIQEDTRQRSVCFDRIHFSEGNKGGGHKTAEAEVTKRVGPRSQPMVILEKESSTRASTCKLVLPEAPESRVAGNLNL
jgi:hypothetical protein